MFVFRRPREFAAAMFQSSKLPARFVTAKLSIARRLHPRARAPYGQRKGLVSWTEANFCDEVPSRTHLEGCERAAGAVPGSGASEKIRMHLTQGPSYASFGWSRQSLSRWNHRGSA
ncbi:uncharacterized protein LOC128093555 [Culex pipiens pallens]|uniref:uncharacterized protein LOC128093555 n=1 Tax=Culex pipiens pallens TaxID=42434 RepID=UPI0022AAD0BC|nr:uncharacterized protein LOC128093555 [Culex pipiens pallens]